MARGRSALAISRDVARDHLSGAPITGLRPSRVTARARSNAAPMPAARGVAPPARKARQFALDPDERDRVGGSRTSADVPRNATRATSSRRSVALSQEQLDGALGLRQPRPSAAEPEASTAKIVVVRRRSSWRLMPGNRRAGSGSGRRSGGREGSARVQRPAGWPARRAEHPRPGSPRRVPTRARPVRPAKTPTPRRAPAPPGVRVGSEPRAQPRPRGRTEAWPVRPRPPRLRAAPAPRRPDPAAPRPIAPDRGRRQRRGRPQARSTGRRPLRRRGFGRWSFGPAELRPVELRPSPGCSEPRWREGRAPGALPRRDPPMPRQAVLPGPRWRAPPLTASSGARRPSMPSAAAASSKRPRSHRRRPSPSKAVPAPA